MNFKNCELYKIKRKRDLFILLHIDENKLNEDKNIQKAIVNFNSSTVTVETDLKDAFTYIKKIVSEIEPDAILSEDKIKENKNKSQTARQR